jgi:hypothetical protein
MAKRYYIRTLNQGSNLPVQPANLVAVAVSSSSITLTWNLVPTATSYTVRRFGVAIATGVTALTYTDSGLPPSTLETYTVSAINSFGEGPQSVPASATTNPGSVVLQPLGVNLAPVQYYSSTMPYLNLMKQSSGGGSFAANSTRWVTLANQFSGTDTLEENYLQLDANGYPTSLVASPIPSGGQVFGVVQTFMCLSQPLGKGCTTTYPPGTYRFKYIGQGTVIIKGDGSLTLSNSAANTYVTGTFTVTTTTSLYLQITAVTSATDYPRDFSVVNTTWTALFDAGQVFNQYYLAQLANFSSLRHMQSAGVYGSYTSFAPAAYPVNASATSITLSAPWLFQSQTRKLYFIDGEVFNATFTMNSAVVQLNGTLANTFTSATWNTQSFFGTLCLVSWSDSFAARTLPSYISWAPGLAHSEPLEVQIAICNQMNADFYFNLPPTVTLSDAVLWIQAIINGTGLQAGWAPLNSNLKVRVEYANETWTFTAFEQGWMTLFGAGQWPTQAAGNPFAWNRNWYGYWIIQIANAMQTALGSTVFNSRVIPVIGAQGQTGNSASVTQALWSASSFWSGSSASNAIVKAIAIADYWPVSYVGWINVADATTLVANGLTDFFLLATTNTPPTASGGSGHTYTSVNAAGYLGYMQSLYSGWTALAATYSIISYEGCSSFVPSDNNGVSGGTVTGYGTFIQNAMRDPRMQTLFTSYVNGWPFGTTQANIRHIYQDCQGFGNPVTTAASQGAFNLIESTMQMNGSTPLPVGQYYKWAAAQAYIGTAPVVPFDFYVSTTGSDSTGTGTLASPWAITAINTKQSTYAGKRLGLLPGTYDVSVLMQAAGYQGAVLQIQGGPNSSTKTYIGSCNSSGAYQAGTATLDAKGSVGLYGGGNTAHSPYVLGQTIGSTGTGPTPTQIGNWTIDGLLFTGFSNWAVTLSGGIDTLTSQPTNCTIQNCGFFNSSTAQTGTHPGPLMLYDYKNCLVHNCWFYNNISTAASDPAHNGASITGEGFGGGSSGLTVEYCSFVQSPGMYVFQDNGAALNTTVRYCYFDMTTTTGISQTCALAGLTGPATGQVGNSFHHNIVRGGSFADNVGLDAYYNGSPTAFYNNTWDRVGGSGGNGLGFRCLETTGQSALISAYNNLMYDNGAGSVSYGYMACNIDGFALCDYNTYGTLNQFTTYTASGGTSNTSRTFAAWQTAIGKDAHSSASSVNPFTNNGAYALQYQISSGSPAYQSGFVGGVSSGAVCNRGAWDGTVTQIGCNLPLP